MKKIWKFIISILIPLGVGAISGFITKGSIGIYKTLERPPLSPPGYIFPIIWTILYILMGISSYLIYVSDSPERKEALKIYIIQLIVNVIWPIIFFNYQLYLISFTWIMILWVLVVKMIIEFKKINKWAALLQIPYLLWTTFATYLTLGVYLLN